MRMLMKVQLDPAGMKEIVDRGEMPEFMETTLERIRPEATYFTMENGRRTALFVFDLKEPSDLPRLSEPFFETGDAQIQCSPVMTVDDLKAGLKKLESGRLATSRR